jgi:hypothetical protein
MTTEIHNFSSCFVKQLSNLHFENVFNPYADTCPAYDKSDAVLIRQRNLTLVLEAALSQGVDSIWIARDLGYRGGRRTGLALTDEVHLFWHAKLLSTPPLEQATQGTAMAERTAAVVWHALQLVNRPIFLWNVFPLHPHMSGNPLSNRCHTKKERKALHELNLWLIETLKPSSVVAIGRDAQAAMVEIGVEPARIRHPSYGGQNDFLNGLADIYKIEAGPKVYQGKLF